MTFSNEGISIQDSKIDALKKALSSRNVSELRSLLGLINYCSRFINNLATAIQLLRELTNPRLRGPGKESTMMH